MAADVEVPRSIPLAVAGMAAARWGRNHTAVAYSDSRILAVMEGRRPA